MDNSMADRMYQASEESWRSSGATWAKAFDAAQSSADLHMWSIEEAAWATYRSAAEARNLAWQLCDQLSGQARERARKEALERIAQGNGTPSRSAGAGIPSPAGVSSPSPLSSSGMLPGGTLSDQEDDQPGSSSFRLDTIE